MAGKIEKNEQLTVDDELLEEEERKALEATEEPEEGDNEKVIKEKPEEGEVTDKEDGKKGKKEGDEEGTGKKVEGEPEGDKGGEEDPLKDAKPVKVEINGEVVEGWLSKSGKYIIPYNDVEKRDQARRTLREANESLESTNRLLEARIAELRAKPQEEIEKEGDEAKLDFKALGKKLYESEDDAAEVLEQVFNAGRKAERAGVGEGSEERVGQVQIDPSKIASEVEDRLTLKQGLETLVGQNPRFKDEKVQYICYQLSTRKIGEKVKDMTKEQADAWTSNVDNLLAVAQEAVNETLEMIGGSQPTPEEKKAKEDAMRKEILEKVATDLNLSEADRRTLGDVGNTGGNQPDRTKELDNLEGEELEEALESLSPQEKEDYLNPET